MAQIEPEPQAQAPAKSLGEKLTSFPKFALYLILATIAALALVPSCEIPVKPGAGTIDLFAGVGGWYTVIQLLVLMAVQ